MPENNMSAVSTPQKTKRQWRVGTLSMGTVLIVFGLVLLLAQFKQFSAVELVSTWWPAVIIILGLEILAAHYFSGEEKPVIKYDLVSVFMVLFIGMVTFGLYALTSVGILPALTKAVASQTHAIEVPEQRFALKEGIKNIVVKGSEFQSGFNSLYIQEADAQEVVAFGQAHVSAASREEASGAIPEGMVNAHTVGDTLFLNFKSVASPNHFQEPSSVDYTLILPRGKNVQVEADTGSPLKLKLNGLEGNWVINSSGTVDATVAANADIKIEAFARRLGGEGKWVPINGAKGSGSQLPMVENPEGGITFGEAEGEYTESKGRAGITFGKGSHKLEIDANEVFVNVI